MNPNKFWDLPWIEDKNTKISNPDETVKETANKITKIWDINFALKYIRLFPVVIIDIFEKISWKKFTHDDGSLPETFKITVTWVWCLWEENNNDLYFGIDCDWELTELYIPRSFDKIIFWRIETHMKLMGWKIN